MKILSRYILRGHVGPFFFGLAALTMVMLLNELGQRFDRLIGKGLHWTVIAEVFGLSIPFIVAMTLPMAVLIAVLYCFNRLAGDNEITAMQANGVPLPRLMVPVLGAALMVAGGLVWFNNTVLPESNHKLQVLLSSISRKKPSFALRERTINEVLKQELYLQAAGIDRNTSALEDVVIYDRREPARSRTIYADSGRMAFNEDQTDLYLTLYRGVSQTRKLSEPRNFQRIHFQKMVMRVPEVSNRLNREQMSRYRSDREMPIGQMQQEVAHARERHEVVVEESRTFAVALTRKLAGLPTDPGSDPGPTSLGVPPAGGAEAPARLVSAGGRSGRSVGSPNRAVEQETQTPDSATLDSAARAARADSARRDSLFAEARREGLEAAGRIQSPGTPSSRLVSYRRRAEAALKRANRFAVEIQKKYSIPAACIVFVLIGAPIAVRYREGGVALVVAVSLGVFCAYYVSLVAGEELADELILSPFWAMWAPNVLFGVLGLGLVWRAVKVG